MQRFWHWVFWLASRQIKWQQTSSCGARWTRKAKTFYRDTEFEITVIYLDLNRKNLYSREELVNMLRIIREQEQIQDWRVPEP